MMLIFKLILYPTIILLGALAVFGYKNVKKIIKKYRGYQDCQVDPEWEGFIRKDFNRWDEKKIIIGSIFRFPFKILILMVKVLIFAALLIFSIRFKRVGEKLQALYIKYVATFALSCLIDITEQGRVSEIKAPLIISNHVNWMDIVYLMIRLHPLGYVCKQELRDLPVIGSITRNMQALFVSRSSQQGRKDILQKIQQRVADYEVKEDVHHFVIFPEGTTSDGRSILRFKLGAFASLPKISIFSLTYDCQGFDMGMDEVTLLQHIIISLSLKTKLFVKMEEVEPLLGEKPEQYMKRCQQKMSELSGFKIYNTGYTEKCAFKQIRLGSQKA